MFTENYDILIYLVSGIAGILTGRHILYRARRRYLDKSAVGLLHAALSILQAQEFPYNTPFIGVSGGVFILEGSDLLFQNYPNEITWYPRTGKILSKVQLKNGSLRKATNLEMELLLLEVSESLTSLLKTAVKK